MSAQTNGVDVAAGAQNRPGRAATFRLGRGAVAALYKRPATLPIGMTVCLLLVALWMFPNFDSFDHLSNMTLLIAFVGLVAFAQTFVILLGGIDLSVPYVMTAGGVLVAGWTAAPNGMPVGLAVIAVLAVAAIVGAINGALVAWLGLSPIIVTLAMNGLVQGALLYYEKGASPGYMPNSVAHLVGKKLAGLSLVGLGAILLTLVLVWVARRTVVGFRLTATGGNLRAAQISGVPVRAVVVGAYVACAVLAAASGILFGGFVQQPYYGMGDPFLFEGIAAVVIGGAALAGGSGGFAGTLAGVVLLVTLDQFMSAMSVSAGAIAVIYGVVILVALLLTSRRPTEE